MFCFRPWNKRIIHYIITALLVGVTLAVTVGCTREEVLLPLGTWKHTFDLRTMPSAIWMFELSEGGVGTTIIFSEDVGPQGEPGRIYWDIVDRKLSITYTIEPGQPLGQLALSDFSISEDGSTLTIYEFSDIGVFVLTRVDGD